MRPAKAACAVLAVFVTVVAGSHRVFSQPGAAVTPRHRIAWATFLGGSQYEQAREVVVLEDGSVLVAGQTNSSDFPVTEGVVQSRYGGDDPALGHGGIYGGDCYVARLSADGTKLLAATYFGGSKQERNVYGMGLDSEGNIVISSATRSADLQTTRGSYQSKYGGGQADMFVAKLSGDLKTLVWSTYIGSPGTDWPRGGIAIDGEDNVYVVGGAESPDFPTTSGVFQRKLKGPRDAAVVKLKADGSGLVWSTLLGGSDWDGLMGVRVDGGGNVYVVGHTRSADFPVTSGAAQRTLGGKSDCFLAKLSPDAGRLLYATYLGGDDNEFAEHRPWLYKDGSVLLTGVTASGDFPTTRGAFQEKLKAKTDGFLVKLSGDGRRFEFSTLLGGSEGEFYLMPTPAGDGNIFFVGTSQSADFPVTSDALDTTYGGGKGYDGDGVLAVMSRDGRKLIYATYLGGRGADLIRGMAFGQKGEVYLVGNTSSPDFPVTEGAFQKKPGGDSDAFVVKLVPAE